MASNAEELSIVIAIDRDRNSQYAVKWAVDHLLQKNSFSCTLIHVRTKSFNPHEFDGVPKHGRPPTEEELHQFFLPFRGFCARKGIVAKELVLHDIDVPNALIDYIIMNSISKIVVGAPRWNLLIRKFKDVDVPTSLIKALPESCMVHIVSKAKVQSIQPAGHSENITTEISSPRLSKDFNRQKSFKSGIRRGLNTNSLLEAQCMSHGETYLPRLSDHGNQHVSQKSNIYRSKSVISPKGTETEIKKIKLDPKRTTKCRSISREADAEKHKAVEVKKFRQEEPDMEKAKVVERQKTSAPAELNVSRHNKTQFRRYNIREIEVATNYFDLDLKVGEGGYGPVFKGVLDHTAVAVKVLRPDLTQGEKQFNQEVLVLSAIRHPNIVELLGACPEYGCLVYEYLENGSLEDRLFRKDNTPPIPWKTRFKIASEIATGLLFLHETKPERVVHRDLKPANILLDRNYVGKITDVGLARLVPPSISNQTTQYHKTAAAGTFCYIDPEYQHTGLLGVKSDIYSFGVILLQIITGRPPIGVGRLVEDAIDKGKFEEVLDPYVTDWPVEETLSFAKLALKCCEMRKRDRPDLASVILPKLNLLQSLGRRELTKQVSNARQPTTFFLKEMSNHPNGKCNI